MFSFEIPHLQDKILVLFSGHLEGGDYEYGNFIDKVFKERDYPYKEVIFINPKFIEDELKSFLDVSGNRIVSNLQRFISVSSFSFWSFNGYAELNCYCKFGNAESVFLENNENLLNSVVKNGIRELMLPKVERVILKAPPGTIFKKPSDTYFREFIKASEIASGSSENQFIAFLLLSKRPKRQVESEIRHIWIDSSSISQFIEPLIYYIARFKLNNNQLIPYSSFQSYGDGEKEGFEVHRPHNSDSVWVIISASTSNRLGRKIFNCWDGIKHDQIVTLLSYEDTYYDVNGYPSKPGDNIVVNISEYSEFQNKEKQFGTEIPVNIIGENFTAQVEKPNTVLLRKPHAEKAVTNFLFELRETSVFNLHKMAGKKVREISFDFNEFLNSKTDIVDKFYIWYEKVLEWYLPSTLGYVIFDTSDESSMLLFDIMNKKFSNKLKALDFSSISNFSDAVAIISPVVGKGSRLIKLNSDLRLNQHDAQRIFICPIVVADSKKQFDSFKKTLTLGPANLNYQFLNFKCCFFGDSEIKDSWDRELEVIENLEKTDFWKSRQSALSLVSQGLNGNVGLSTSPTDFKLNFNKDFAFWDKDYIPNNVNHSVVYSVVSSILQNLREKQLTQTNRESLAKHVYQQSVIDPQNFSRFNDPLLQSCLWRAAHNSEIDYRSSKDCSSQILQIINKIFEDFSNGHHNSSLDILMSIAIGKLKVHEDDKNEIISLAKKFLSSNNDCSVLISYIENPISKLESGVF